MGYNISNARKLHFCKQPFESIQGQIAFKNTVQGLLPMFGGGMVVLVGEGCFLFLQFEGAVGKMCFVGNGWFGKRGCY